MAVLSRAYAQKLRFMPAVTAPKPKKLRVARGAPAGGGGTPAPAQSAPLSTYGTPLFLVLGPTLRHPYPLMSLIGGVPVVVVKGASPAPLRVPSRHPCRKAENIRGTHMGAAHGVGQSAPGSNAQRVTNAGMGR